MSGDDECLFRIEFPAAASEPLEITWLRGAVMALDYLTADEALAAAEYLVRRYQRLVVNP